MANIRQFLDLSTDHLDDASREWLEREAEAASTYCGFYGFFTCAYPDPDNPGHPTADQDRPPVLHAIYQRAVALGCDYVLLDSDAPTDSELPSFAPEEGSP